MPTWWWWCARTLTYQMSNFCPSPSLRVKQRSILGSPQLLSPGPHAVTGPAPAALMVPLRCFPTQRPAHGSDQGRKQQQWDEWTDVKPWLWRGDGSTSRWECDPVRVWRPWSSVVPGSPEQVDSWNCLSPCQYISNWSHLLIAFKRCLVRTWTKEF